MTNLLNFGILMKDATKACFATSSPTPLLTKKLLFNQPKHMNKLLTIYIKKQKTCQTFAADACIHKSLKTMVYIGTRHVVATCLCNQVYKIWKQLPDENCIWLKWKSYWTQEFTNHHNIQQMMHTTHSQHDVNATRAQHLTQNKLVDALDNLENSATSKNVVNETQMAIIKSQ